MEQNNNSLLLAWQSTGLPIPSILSGQYYGHILLTINNTHPTLLRFMDADGNVYIAPRISCNPYEGRYMIEPNALVRISCEKSITNTDDIIYNTIIRHISLSL